MALNLIKNKIRIEKNLCFLKGPFFFITLNSSLAISILHPRLQMIGFFGLKSHSFKCEFKFSSLKMRLHPLVEIEC